MRVLAFILVLVGNTFNVMSAQQNGRVIEQEVVVDFDDKGNLYRIHVAAKGVGLKYIASLYGTTEEAISKFNSFRQGHVLLEGDLIKIPFKKEDIQLGVIGDGPKSGYLPLIYIVKPKETLYRISKVYFEQDLKAFQERNKMIGTDISIGQRLHVGWVSQKTGSTAKANKSDNIDKLEPLKRIELPINKDVVDTDVIDLTGVEWKKQRAIAYWEKFEEGDGGRCYVLHPTARINTVMEIYNPMLRRKVKAKVLGRIPDDTYRKDISILLSPTAARALGALDSRFMVELYYAE